MNSPLVLGIVASKPKTLSVSYSLPNVRYLKSNSSTHYLNTPSEILALKLWVFCLLSPPQEDQSPSMLLLDFGDVILTQAVTKQLLITNQTAIPAPFSIQVEYFTCHALKSQNQSEKK